MSEKLAESSGRKAGELHLHSQDELRGLSLSLPDQHQQENPLELDRHDKERKRSSRLAWSGLTAVHRGDPAVSYTNYCFALSPHLPTSL